MSRAIRRIAKRLHIDEQAAGVMWIKAQAYVAEAGSNPLNAFRLAADREKGAVNVQMIIMIFIAIVILYQLIPQLSSSNATVQASANATAMAKFAAGLGEWMFPLLGIIAVVFLLFKGKKNSGV
jgi:hypothetical protein